MKTKLAVLTIAISLTVPAISRADYFTPPRDAIPADVAQQMRGLGERQYKATIDLGLGQSVIVQTTPEASRRKIAENWLGRGFNIWTGATFERCVQPAKDGIVPIPFVPNVPNPRNVQRMKSVSSLSEHHGNRSSGGGLSLVYDILSVSGKVAEYEANFYRRQSRYVDAYVLTLGHEYWLTEGAPTADADGRFDPKNPEAFTKICGQRFVSRVGFGTLLDGQVRFDIAVDKKMQENQAGVSLGIGQLLSFSADNAAKVKELSEKSTISVVLKGAPAPKPEDFFEVARTFPATSNPWDSLSTIFIETTSYSELGFAKFRSFDDFVMQAAGTVQQFAADRAAILQDLSDLQQVEEAMDMLEIPVTNNEKQGEAIVRERTVRTGYLDRLSKTIAECSSAVVPASISKCTDAAKAVGVRPPRLVVTFKATP